MARSNRWKSVYCHRLTSVLNQWLWSDDRSHW
jgi:hypothetical protein